MLGTGPRTEDEKLPTGGRKIGSRRQIHTDEIGRRGIETEARGWRRRWFAEQRLNDARASDEEH